MKALIDMDILPYEIGSVFTEEDYPELVTHTVDNKINEIIKQSGCNDYQGFLTDSKSNFRLGVATIAPYKGHRPTEKPYWWSMIRSYIECEYDPIVCYGYEADDFIGDMARADIEGTVICSRDKDLDTIPGWHYRWACGERQPERKYYLNDHEADKYFFTQLLTGDIADNIKGCYGIGAKKAASILSCPPSYFFQVCLATYTQIFGEGEIYYEDIHKARYWRTAKEIMRENAELLWIGSQNRDVLARIFNA